MSYIRGVMIVLTAILVYFSVQVIVGNWEEIQASFNDTQSVSQTDSPAEGAEDTEGGATAAPSSSPDPGMRDEPETTEGGDEKADGKKKKIQKAAANALDQLLSGILAALASAIVGLFTKKEPGADALAESNSRSGGSGTLSESAYVERVASRHDKLKGKHKELREAYKRMARRLYKTRALATRRIRASLVLSTAVLFAVGCMVASGLEVFLNLRDAGQGVLGPHEALDFLTVQMGITCAFALVISCLTYRRYVQVSGKAGFMSALYIGGIGIALPSLFGYLVQSPETWAATIANTSTVDVAGFRDVPIAVYQALTHLVAYPLVGILGCAISGTTIRRK